MNVTGNIPARIKLARKMAGLATQAQLLERIPHWKPSRLGNYEAGVSVPNPDDMLLIAEATGVSPCWLMFGLGPIRPSERDQQAIRHQNLTLLSEQTAKEAGDRQALARLLDLAPERLDEHLNNPFLPIDDGLARRCEQALHRPLGWMDEQHVEHDPLCLAFPDDMRELMMLYSGLTPEKRKIVLETVRTLTRCLS
ncbi:MAG: helix-turn-helix transcriptional regulator [Candidatus Competibacteraceae bacterium]